MKQHAATTALPHPTPTRAYKCSLVSSEAFGLDSWSSSSVVNPPPKTWLKTSANFQQLPKRTNPQLDHLSWPDLSRI